MRMLRNLLRTIPQGVLDTASGSPCALDNSTGEFMNNCLITGNSLQEGTPTPDAPVAIQNLGKLVTEGEHIGKYAVPIVVHGFNLFAGNSTDNPQYIGQYYCQPDGRITANANSNCFKIKVYPNTTYCVSREKEAKLYNFGLIHYLDIEGSLIGTASGLYDAVKFGTFTTPTNCAFIRVALAIALSENFTINLSSSKNGTYETYQGNTTTTIYLDEPLRQGDTIDFQNQKVRRARTVISSYNGETVGSNWISTTGALTTGATVEYELATPVDEPFSLPDLQTFKGTTIVEVTDGALSASNIVVVYKTNMI